MLTVIAITAAVIAVAKQHEAHVYTKLGLTSRVQLAQEAARHA